MTAPKPRVEHDDECWWIWWWSCPCGEHTEPWELDAFGFEELVASATHHSRIHSAERIADYLQELSDNTGDAFTQHGDHSEVQVVTAPKR